MRDDAPLPMLSRKALSASKASTSRKSNCSAPGTAPTCQVAPPSVVRRKVPLVPLAQTTLALTAHKPRSEAFVATFCSCHCACAAEPLQHNMPHNNTNLDQFI